MSDDEAGSKKSGYRLEYASSARAKCKGPKPCNGTPIAKGELRFGTVVDMKGHTSFAWRHWGCVTSKIISNAKKSFDEADELDGFEDMKDEDQERIRKAWEDGHVADEDIPDTARKPEEDDDGKAKKKKGKAAKKSKDVDEDMDDEEAEEDEKPAQKKAASGKATKKEKDNKPGVFKFEYASSSRAKCKGGCDESIGKDYLRLGHESDFRGNKIFNWHHFGCVPASLFSKFKDSYPEPTQVQGWDDLQDADKEKVQRAWDNGSVPEDDQGPGEPRAGAPVAKKASGKKEKKVDDEDSEPPKKRAKKSKKDEEDHDEAGEKPKAGRASTKKAQAAEKKSTAATKKRVSKKAKGDDESGEDFGAAIDAVSSDEEEEAEEKEEEKEESSEGSKKRKRAPPSKASTSKPASKSASKAAAKPASKAATKPTSKRRKQKIEEDGDDE